MRRFVALTVAVVSLAAVPFVGLADQCAAHKQMYAWFDFPPDNVLQALWVDPADVGCGANRASITDTAYFTPSATVMKVFVTTPDSPVERARPTNASIVFTGGGTVTKSLQFTYGTSWESNEVSIPAAANKATIKACIVDDDFIGCHNVTFVYTRFA
jgi:hypothetical protein